MLQRLHAPGQLGVSNSLDKYVREIVRLMAKAVSGIQQVVNKCQFSCSLILQQESAMVQNLWCHGGTKRR